MYRYVDRYPFASQAQGGQTILGASAPLIPTQTDPGHAAGPVKDTASSWLLLCSASRTHPVSGRLKPHLLILSLLSLFLFYHQHTMARDEGHLSLNTKFCHIVTMWVQSCHCILVARVQCKGVRTRDTDRIVTLG